MINGAISKVQFVKVIISTKLRPTTKYNSPHGPLPTYFQVQMERNNGIKMVNITILKT